MEEESLALYTLKAHSSPVRIQVGAFVPCCPSSYSFLVAEESWLKHFSCSPSPFLLSIFTLTTCQTYWRVPELHTPSAPPSSLRWGLASAPPRDRWSGWCWNKETSTVNSYFTNEYTLMYRTSWHHIAEHLQGLCRFIFLCVWVFILGVLSLSSASCEKSSSHQQSCRVSISCVLQQVVHYETTPQTHKMWQ